jgi:hypothetical protein
MFGLANPEGLEFDIDSGEVYPSYEIQMGFHETSHILGFQQIFVQEFFKYDGELVGTQITPITKEYFKS